MTGSKVGVCVLSYNRGKYLREAVKSVLGQTLIPDWIEIMDNGSDPAVFDSIKPWVESGKVLWRGSDVNRGVHWNLQRAFQRGKDVDFLYVMHDDDRLMKNFLSKQVGFLRSNPSVIAVSCNAREIDQKGVRSGFLHKPYRRRSVEVFKGVPDMVRLYMRTFMAFPSVVYRGGAVSSNPVLKRFGQVVDVVFLTELARKGTLAYQNRVLFEYRVHGAQDSSVFKEDDWRVLENYYLSLSKEFPDLALSVYWYLARRRLSRAWKRLKSHVKRKLSF